MKNLLRNLLPAVVLLATQSLFAQNFNLQLRSTLEYPGQTLANICGYAQDGREYALLGGSAGLIIVDVTNPASPVNITQIPGPNNLWKEIKVYDHYAYVTSEGGQGLQIVDLSSLPGSSLSSKFYTGDGAIAGQLNTIHALHIDVKKGFVYLYGSNLFSGGAVVLDLNADPYNPTYAGKFDALGYIHDGYADNDTLYASHIYTGLLSIVDMGDKQNPALLGTVQTPGKFTHNAWITGDRKHILTTDETTPSFVTSYDVSDPSDIKELDRTSPNDGTNSIGHNTHVISDWAVTSWYTDGVVISDVHKPDNMVITGWYDTWAGSGANFDGCWGVYPYLPSGTVIASNIPNTSGGTGKLFVLTPTYVRACYLEGKITNGCNGQPLNGASITVNSNDPWINTTSNNLGVFKTGQVEPGSFKVTISKPGFESVVVDVNLATAQVTELNIQLNTANATNVEGTVFSASTLQPIGSASVVLNGPAIAYEVQTDATGHYGQECVAGGSYTIAAGAWGYLTQTISVSDIAAGIPPIYLEEGYQDDFGVDLGWSTETNATSGAWERGEPVGTIINNSECNPDNDIDTDFNDECYVTGNGGGQAGNDDVDNGSVTLTSPVMKLAGNDDAILSFWYWFYNGGGQGNPNDKFEVRAINGTQNVLLFGDNIPASDWNFSGDIHLKDYITLNNNVRIQFTTADDAPGHLVEAAVDGFKVVPVKSSGTKPDIDVRAFLQATPNPASTEFALRYEWPEAGDLTLEVRNALGQPVQTQTLGAAAGAVHCGNNWPKGVYFATLRSAGKQSAPLRLIKQ
jgi:choice-of-anchor B domain-containing protein